MMKIALYDLYNAHLLVISYVVPLGRSQCLILVVPSSAQMMNPSLIQRLRCRTICIRCTFIVDLYCGADKDKPFMCRRQSQVSQFRSAQECA